jgi:hypothetical protein
MFLGWWMVAGRREGGGRDFLRGSRAARKKVATNAPSSLDRACDTGATPNRRGNKRDNRRGDNVLRQQVRQVLDLNALPHVSNNLSNYLALSLTSLTSLTTHTLMGVFVSGALLPGSRSSSPGWLGPLAAARTSPTF